MPSGCSVVTCPQCPTNAYYQWSVIITQDPPTGDDGHSCNDYSTSAIITYDGTGCEWIGSTFVTGYTVELIFNSSTNTWDLAIDYPDVKLIWSLIPVAFNCCGPNTFPCNPSSFPCDTAYHPAPCAQILPYNGSYSYTGDISGGITVSGISQLSDTFLTSSLGGIVVSGLGLLNDNVVMLGGISISGLSDGQLDAFKQIASGGVDLEGEPILSRTVVYNAGGTIFTGGSVGVTFLSYAAGGMVLSSMAICRPNVVYIASGTVFISGSALPSSLSGIIASGGISLGGAGTYSGSISVVVSGGMVLGGIAPCYVRETVESKGGLSLGGSSTCLNVLQSISLGGIVTGGSYDDSSISTTYHFIVSGIQSRVYVFGSAVYGGNSYDYDPTGGIFLFGGGIFDNCDYPCDPTIPFFREYEKDPGCQTALSNGEIVFTCARLQYITPKSTIPRREDLIGAYLPAVTVCEQNRMPKKLGKGNCSAKLG